MSRPRPSQPVESADRQSVRAIVVDTTAFGKGSEFNVERIAAWARDASEAELELWLPEIVLWELASNVADRHEEARSPARRADRVLRRAGLSGLELPYSSRQAVVDSVVASANSQPLRIIETTAEEAREALKDQIQIRPPGKRKNEVKTGAADSAWVRSILREASEILDEQVVVVSSDRDVDRMIAREGLPNIFVGWDWNELRQHLFEYQASHEAALDLARLLVRAVGRGDISDLLDLSSVQDAGFAADLEDSRWGEKDPLSVHVDMQNVSALAALRDVQANTRGGVHATAVFLADVAVTGWFDDQNGELVSDTHNAFDAVIEAPISVVIEGGRVALATVDDRPALLPTPTRWEDEYDALGTCLIQLHNVPALATAGFDFSLLGLSGEDNEASVPLGETELHVQVSIEVGSRWQIDATAGGDEIEVHCEYDDSAYVGGSKEGVWMEPPYELSVTSGDYINPLYGLSAFAMAKSVEDSS